MGQAALAFDRKHTGITFAQTRPEMYWPGFALYLQENWQVYEAFERKALELWRAGRRHYGHRSLWEVLRYESLVRESRGDFKLNDHYTKSIARLFEEMNPQCAGLFEFRERAVANQREVRAA